MKTTDLQSINPWCYWLYFAKFPLCISSYKNSKTLGYKLFEFDL